MADLSTLTQEVHAWQTARWPDDPPENLHWFKLAKAMEELGEVAEALIRDDPEHAAIECADVVICLAALCGVLGYDLATMVESKWAEVQHRKPAAEPLSAEAGDTDG
jgi:NTP pyrophosphatase (non-canonical NTP hydrolase)